MPFTTEIPGKKEGQARIEAPGATISLKARVEHCHITGDLRSPEPLAGGPSLMIFVDIVIWVYSVPQYYYLISFQSCPFIDGLQRYIILGELTSRLPQGGYRRGEIFSLDNQFE